MYNKLSPNARQAVGHPFNNGIKLNDRSMILATDSKGNEITIAQVEIWLQSGEKKKLAELFYDRFYGRYLKQFDFPDPSFRKKFKNGFAIMTSCCLLIETFVSWTEPVFKNTTGNSERCFGYFFQTQTQFQDFARGGLDLWEYLNVGPPKRRLNNTGIPLDFYRNVRCGILHNGEIRNGWKISRTGLFFDLSSKRINAVKFMNRLKAVMVDFREQLKKSDFQQATIWKTYKDRLQDLIEHS